MKFTLPIILVVATATLMVLGLFVGGQARGTIGIAAGSAVYTPKASTPEQALKNLLVDVQRRNWDRALTDVSKNSITDKQAFIQDWTGSNGSLRSFSALEGFESRPLHITNDEAQMRVRLHWATPVGPLEDVRDFHLIREGDVWKTVLPKIQVLTVPAQVIPVTYLRWDLVSGGGADEWGSKNVDAPHVRIISMNAVDSAEGAVVMGLGGTLFEAIEFAEGKITNGRLSRYRVPRFSDIPVLETVLVDRKDLPSAGAGETPIVAVAPAIGNAIFHATGQRLRSLPMVPNGLPEAQ